MEAYGTMLEFSDNPWSKLVAFLQGDSQRYFVIIGGQADGFFALNYHSKLVELLKSHDWTVVQALFTSWYAGYKEATLENDKEDLDLLLRKLSERGAKEFVLMGHHTGAQDVLFYMQNGEYADKVSFVIFQGGIRDPVKYKENDASTQGLYTRTATQMVAEGRGNQLLPASMHPIPISAYRFLALGGMQGVQDFFNPLQTDAQMAEWVGHIQVPMLVIFCLDGDYQVSHAERTDLLDKIQTCVDADVTCKWLPGGCDEHLNFLKGFEEETVAAVVSFLSEENHKRGEREDEVRREVEAETKRGRSVVYQKPGIKRSISQSSISSNK
eukprot:NODE_985_length_1110_cov_227.787936_g682_i0.p2 GENE.NODE_985_length_1110_cov_227.787936_g682_i0~~NODE_985_length_1110_cov_227.787936_g682_i0.p2  ORF type:complete len:356 (+),score=180.38 NODE_985_length_1110_cov_227.787936_g682_i0:91-1068(+)